MKRQVIFPTRYWQQIARHFLTPGHEQAALAYAGVCQSADRFRLLVNEVELLSAADLEAQTGTHVVPTPETIANAVGKAIASGRALLHLHNHLWHGPNAFSDTDLATFHKTSVWASANFQLTQAAVVLGLDEGAVDAVVWSSHEEEVVPVSEIHIVGFPYSVYIPASAKPRLAIFEELARQHALKMPPYATVLPMFDRQIRAFGPELQHILSHLRVGIVGLSGTGSHAVVGLAHLGVEDYVLCDPEIIGLENLNRIMGATYDDVVTQQPKVAVAERVIKKIRPWAKLEPLQCSVLDEPAIQSLKAVDVLFGCTDTASSRMLQNDLACQYHIPYIDVGTGIFVTEQCITNMGGQIHIMLPNSPCLDCRDALNRERAAQELMSGDQKAFYRARGYVIGSAAPQPQVIQLNGLIVNQALMEFLNLFTHFKPHQSFLLYDALKPGFLECEVGQVPGCLHCSHRGSGDSQPGVSASWDTGTEISNPASSLTQNTNGGFMAKPIPHNPNFKKRTSSGQGHRQSSAHTPQTPVTPPATSQQPNWLRRLRRPF